MRTLPRHVPREKRPQRGKPSLGATDCRPKSGKRDRHSHSAPVPTIGASGPHPLPTSPIKGEVQSSGRGEIVPPEWRETSP